MPALIDRISDHSILEVFDLRSLAHQQAAQVQSDTASVFAEVMGLPSEDLVHETSTFDLDTEFGVCRVMAPWVNPSHNVGEEVNYATVDLSNYTLPKAIDQAIEIATATPRIGVERGDGPGTLLALGYFDIQPPPLAKLEDSEPEPKKITQPL
jgi:hypothetical protein